MRAWKDRDSHSWLGDICMSTCWPEVPVEPGLGSQEGSGAGEAIGGSANLVKLKLS